MGKRKKNIQREGERKSARQQSENSSGTVLPNICIFCNRTSKYKAGTNTRELLRCCSEMGVDNRIRDLATKKHDARVLSVTANELVAKEAKYHPSCYRNYTRPEKQLNGPDTIKIDVLKTVINDSLKNSEGHTVRLTELKSKLQEEFQRLEVECDTFLKNIKRSIERHIPEAKILCTSDGDIICYANYAIEDFAALYISKRDETHQFHQIDKNIVSAAKAIQSEVKESNYKMTWPPPIEQLDMRSFHTLPLLEKFLSILITNQIVPSKNRQIQVIASLSQDIYYAVHNGKMLTPKSILLPLLIKSLTNNTELITTVSRLGHGVSYTKLSEITTEVAYSRISKASEDGVVSLPEECRKGVFTMIVEDNIDRNEETLTGYGTTHKVNSIIIQEGGLNADSLTERSENEVTEDVQQVVYRRRSFTNNKPEIQYYISSKRQGPKVPFKLTVNEARELLLADQQVLNLAWLLSRRSPLASHIPSWTGFHIKLRSHVPVSKNLVAYLDCLDAPATEMSTIYHMMERATKIKHQLGVQTLVCVYDQAIYAKAKEIQLKEQQKFNSIFLMMGTFHILLMSLAIVGVRFKDAGMKDVYIQSEIVAEGSIDSVLRGKQYNRAIRAHKIFWEAMWCLLLEKFETEADVSVLSMPECNDAELQKLAASPEFHNYVDKLDDFQSKLCQESEMFKFWQSYLTIMENILCILYATRTGDWTLYVESIRSLLPWTFAYDRQNYAKRRPWSLMMRDSNFIKLFAELGRNWELEEESIIPRYESFVCTMYGSRTCKSVNTRRFQLYREGNGKIDAKSLPPCLDSLTHHLHRANYQAAIWRRCMMNDPETPSPIGYGWQRGEDGELEINWVSLKPAPNEILELISCHCQRKCKQETCPCWINKLKCSDACHKFDCENELVLDDEESSDEESDSDSETEELNE